MKYLIELTTPDGWIGYVLDRDENCPGEFSLRLALPLEEATRRAQELTAACGPGYTYRAIPESEATPRKVKE